MDGFEGGEGVIVIAATNRPDVLDPAAAWPFDRQVVVGLPDVKGREHILKVHAQAAAGRRRRADGDRARYPGLLRRRPGQPLQRGRLFAARNEKEVRMDHFDRARDKILMGAERRSMAMSEERPSPPTTKPVTPLSAVWYPSMIRSTRSRSFRVAVRWV